jgi:uncharacterized protein
LSLVERIHRHALLHATEHNLNLCAGLLSNGAALTQRHFAAVRDLGLQLMISLDGLGEWHDQQRMTQGGAPTAARVCRTIERALAAGIQPDIAVTVTSLNVDGLPELLEWLLDRDLRFSLSFYRENDYTTSHEQLALDERRLIEGLRNAYAVIERRLPSWSLLGALLDRTDLSHSHGHTCAVGHDYLVVDQQGRIAKCQMEIDKPVTSIDAFDPLATLRADHNGVINLHVDQKAGCKTCEWRYWCAGGCPVATYRATGRNDLRSPNCAIYKALYPAVLQLEGQRLLHYHRQAA